MCAVAHSKKTNPEKTFLAQISYLYHAPLDLER
jgi:hypothetical protein